MDRRVEWIRFQLVRVTVYLDESGTHEGSAHVLVGALVSLDAEGLEHAVAERAAEVAADSSLWTMEPGKRAVFSRRWFHHSEDDDTVRGRFAETLGILEFRAHVCYSRRTLGLADTDLLLVMYYTVARNLLRRYAGQELEFIFEENPAMNSLYGQLAKHAVGELARLGTPIASATARLGRKPLGGLSAVDYVLAFTEHHLAQASESGSRTPKPFQLGRFQQIGPHLAHLIDFDSAVHRRQLGRML